MTEMQKHILEKYLIGKIENMFQDYDCVNDDFYDFLEYFNSDIDFSSVEIKEMIDTIIKKTNDFVKVD